VKHSRPHILLVNPWITDFAAFNLWSRPLGLLEIGGWLRDAGFRVSLVDCVDAENFSLTDPFHPKISPFGTGKLKRTPIKKPPVLASVPRRYCRYGINPEEFDEHLARLSPPDLIFVTSVMTYWYPGVQECVEHLRRHFPRTPLWLGGNYATLIPAHARAVCRPDRVVPGPFVPQYLEQVFAMLGRPAAPVDSETRGLPFWEGYGTHHFLCVRSSRGCPFHCQYCASNLLMPRFEEHPIEEVAEAIVREYFLYKVRDFAFYDDALLMNAESRLIPLLDRLRQVGGLSLRFHTPNGIHVRFISPKVARYMKEAGFHTLRLSLEMTQPVWQARLGAKATLEEFDRALSCLFEAGFTESAIRVYLLVGLPGQTLDEVEQGIREVQKRGVQPSLAEYSPIPGTALWEEACRASSYPLREEPLTHNNTLLPCGGGGVTKAALDRLRRLMGDQERFSDLSENGPVESEALAHEKPHEKHTG
jgi:hypothetical protein